MSNHVTEILSPDEAGLSRAVTHLRAGACVGFPTETVYGLGADARSASAVAGIYSAKGRPANNPLIVHCHDLASVARIAEIPDLMRGLAERFWPGPLTLVVRRRAGLLCDAVSAGMETVAVRVPAHPVAQALLRAFDGPLAAPSANVSGAISPTTHAHVLDGLSGRIAAVLDGGSCPVGVESTIIGLDGDTLRILRPGGITEEELRADGCSTQPGEAVVSRDSSPTAPGQFESHYAPSASIRLSASSPKAGEAWLGFGPTPNPVTSPALNLSETGSLEEAAQHLFDMLRSLDARIGENGVIAIAPVPDVGLGRAINDRLRRAAAPRG